MQRIAAVVLAVALTAPVARPQGTASDNPPSRVARISVLTGQASVQPAGNDEWGDATLNYAITTGDRLYTAPGSRLELEIGPVVVRLSENADVTVTSLIDNVIQIAVAQGTVRLSVYRLLDSDSVEVDTPNGAMVVSRPGRYRVDVPEDGRYSVVSVDLGAAGLVGPGLDRELRARMAAQLSGTDYVRLLAVARPARTPFDQWSDDRDGRAGAPACARYMSYDIPGCADLDEAGQWEVNAEYGAVWYPLHVRVDWVPYCDGRWVWIAPWGWTWVDDAPWGFAPFHYGRWAHFGRGWGWIPGPIVARPYYAPALVVFIGGPGWTVAVGVPGQAWFPLGPREAYFPSYHHDDRYLHAVNGTNIRVMNLNVIIHEQRTGPARFVNQGVGITAIPADAFRNGRPVGREIVKVRPEEIQRASVIPHPGVVPVRQAVLGGRPVARPPVPPRPTMRPMTGTRGGPPGAGAPPSRGAPPPARGAPPPTRGAPPPARGAPPPTRGAPPTRGGRGRGEDTQQAEAKTIITRSPPPPDAPPFKDQEKALQARPGRPLEPAQVNNVRAGKPAGPPKDSVMAPRKMAPAPKEPPKAPPKEPPRGGRADTGRGRGRGGV